VHAKPLLRGPADAIAVAVKATVPIYAADEVIDKAIEEQKASILMVRPPCRSIGSRKHETTKRNKSRSCGGIHFSPCLFFRVFVLSRGAVSFNSYGSASMSINWITKTRNHEKEQVEELRKNTLQSLPFFRVFVLS
jgi:hypothetical protein